MTIQIWMNMCMYMNIYSKKYIHIWMCKHGWICIYIYNLYKHIYMYNKSIIASIFIYIYIWTLNKTQRKLDWPGWLTIMSAYTGLSENMLPRSIHWWTIIFPNQNGREFGGKSSISRQTQMVSHSLLNYLMAIWRYTPFSHRPKYRIKLGIWCI